MGGKPPLRPLFLKTAVLIRGRKRPSRTWWLANWMASSKLAEVLAGDLPGKLFGELPGELAGEVGGVCKQEVEV